MPLTKPEHNEEFVLNRRRVFVDTADAESGDKWDGVYRLADGEIENVQGIELVDYRLPRAIAPTFVSATTDHAGNNKLDVLLTDNPVTTSVRFTVTFDPGVYTQASLFAADLKTALETAMDAAGHPSLNTSSGVDFVVTVLSTGPQVLNLLIVKSRLSANETSVLCTFEFGSGANATDSAWKVMGFEEGTDNGGFRTSEQGTALFDPFPVRPLNFAPYQTLTISERQIPELDPIATVSLVDTTVQFAYPVPSAVNDAEKRPLRLLRDAPLRRMDKLYLTCRLDEGVKPVTEFDSVLHFDLVFDIYYLVPLSRAPHWLDQHRRVD